jgi:hypothetical protein
MLVDILNSYRIFKVVEDLNTLLLNFKSDPSNIEFGKEFTNYYDEYNSFSFDEYSTVEIEDDDDYDTIFKKFIEIPYYVKFSDQIDIRLQLINPIGTIFNIENTQIDFPIDTFKTFKYYYDIIRLYVNLPFLQDDCSFEYQLIIKDDITLNCNLLSISKLIYKQEHLSNINHNQMLKIGKQVIKYCREHLVISKSFLKGKKIKDGQQIEFIMYPNTKEVYDTIIKCLEQIIAD